MPLRRNHDLFLRFSGWALILTAVTTLVAHLVDFPTSSYDEKIQLFQNWGYILRNDAIILHCVLVIVSMYGFGLLEFENSPGWIGIGFFCFVVFGLAEIVRMTTANVVVNGLREQYYLSDDTVVRESIAFILDSVWPLVGEELFLIFILAFSLGCLFYGVAFRERHWIGWVLIVWGAVNLFAFANSFWRIRSLDAVIEIFSICYQPTARLVMGIWFLREVNRLRIDPNG